jgi:hypothetical protein
MAQTPINGRTGDADVMLTLPPASAASYKSKLNLMEFESVVPQEQVTVFSTETAPKFEPGIEVISFRLMGYLEYGTAQSQPFFPLTGLQNIVATFTVAPGCTVAGNLNFSRGMVRRASGVRGIMSGEGVFNGAIVVTWAIA